MDNTKQISSLQNPLVKKVLQLKEKSRDRKKTGLFVLEGRRELSLAFKAGYEIKTVFICPDIDANQDKKRQSLLKDLGDGFELIEVSKAVYHKLAYRDSTEGVLAILKGKGHSLNKIQLKENPLILVAEAPEKPGNIGALLRTADAANLDAVFIANPKGDLYNPNIIRSSIGCVFTNQIGVGNTSEIIDFLKESNIDIYCAALSTSIEYTKVNFKNAAAIVVGTESTGLSQEWLNAATQNIIIPMEGEIDSMNVSVSAAILIFEAKRQRKL